MDWFGYGRISEEDDGNAENVDIQLLEQREWVEERGESLIAQFDDRDRSAYRDGVKRPGYDDLIAAINAHPRPCGIVVTEMSRLNRKIWRSIDLFRLAETTHLQRIETTTGRSFDLSTQQGIHNAIEVAMDAEKESMRIGERQRRKHGARAKKGLHNGGPRPYGYDKVPAVRDARGRVVEPVRLVINEHEAEIICDCVRKLLEGHSVKSIVVDLNAKGETTSTGQRWHTTSLKSILTSPRIKGVRGHNGREYPGQWDAIITPEEWDRVQLILKAESRYVGADKKGGRSYLLTGLLICGACGEDGQVCGNQLIGFGRENNKGQRERRYFCVPTDPTGARRGCGKVARLADPIELLVTEAAFYRFESEGLGDALSKAEHEDDLSELMDEYRARKLKLDDLIADYASGLLNREQLAQAKGIVERALEETRLRLAQLETGRVFAAMPLDGTIRETWNANGLDWRRKFLSLLVERVIVHPGRPGVRPWPAKDSDLWHRSHPERQWNFDPSKVEIVWKA
jgi:site-specific DNA recombinase